MTAFLSAIFAAPAAMGLGALLGNGYRAKNLPRLADASGPGRFDVIRNAELQINSLCAMRFESDRIVFINQTGDAYHTLFYSDFQLGDLSPDDYYLPCFYFVHQYPNAFTWMLETLAVSLIRK